MLLVSLFVRSARIILEYNRGRYLLMIAKKKKKKERLNLDELYTYFVYTFMSPRTQVILNIFILDIVENDAILTVSVSRTQ